MVQGLGITHLEPEDELRRSVHIIAVRISNQRKHRLHCDGSERRLREERRKSKLDVGAFVPFVIGGIIVWFYLQLRKLGTAQSKLDERIDLTG